MRTLDIRFYLKETSTRFGRKCFEMKVKMSICFIISIRYFHYYCHHFYYHHLHYHHQYYDSYYFQNYIIMTLMMIITIFISIIFVITCIFIVIIISIIIITIVFKSTVLSGRRYFKYFMQFCDIHVFSTDCTQCFKMMF